LICRGFPLRVNLLGRPQRSAEDASKPRVAAGYASVSYRKGSPPTIWCWSSCVRMTATSACTRRKAASAGRAKRFPCAPAISCSPYWWGARAGEHYAGEEREVMAHVAHAMAASLSAPQARAIEELLAAVRAEAASSAARASALREALRALGAGPSVSAGP
jgi:hypothetical protein